MSMYICAFSSDFRELYKSDIYKVLSLPEDSIVHFRYKFKYVEDAILGDHKSIIDNDAILYFSANNTSQNVPDNFSVRKAKVVSVEKSNETELFHVYFLLKKHCDVIVDPTVSQNCIPSKKFFYRLNCIENSNGVNWIDRVNVLKSYFPSHCFYYIKSIRNSQGRVINSRISKDKKYSFYSLNHGSKYLAELSIANPNGTSCKLYFRSSSDDISANVINPIEITAEFDDITIPIYIKSLSVYKESSFVSFIPKDGKKINSEYTLNIEIEKKIGLVRTCVFGLYSLIAVASIWVIKDNSESIMYIGEKELDINWYLIVACLTLLFSSSMLFSQFNKK